jgi:hypothetical protein
MEGILPMMGTRICFLCVSCLFFGWAPSLRADGGTLRLRERVGSYNIAVFMSPAPLCAGPVDFSVLVQDAATGECLPDLPVTIRLAVPGSGKTLEYPATKEAATNKLFRAAVFELPVAGKWDVHVDVDAPPGTAGVEFRIEAAEPPPRWLELWPWYTWPVVAIAIFGVHQTLARRRAPVGAENAILTAGRACEREIGRAQVEVLGLAAARQATRKDGTIVDSSREGAG